MVEPGPGGAIIREVVGLDSPYLPVAIDLFKEIFPEDTRYVPYLRACALQRSPSHPATFDHVWVVEQQGRYVGVRIFSYVHTRNFGHGAYIGVLPPYRSQGLGAWLAKQTLAQLCVDAAHLSHPEPLGYCIEVERVEDAADEAERRDSERRLAFHHRCGGIILDVDYTEPPMIEGVDYITSEELAGEEPRPMHLVLIPAHPGIELSQDQVIDLMAGTYLDVYRLARDSWYLRQAMASIRASERYSGRA
jgi:GNAT superfamily N-acetyltransferase